MVNNQLDNAFRNIKRQKRKALIAYLAAGYPKLTEEKNLIKEMMKNGVDIMEVGIPFSDPIADGPTIQFASQKALHNGVTVGKILKWVGELKQQVPSPIVIMTYINPVLAYGVKRFAAEAARAGVNGLIVPDMVPEESANLRKDLAAKNIHLIHLVAPTTPRARLRMIAKQTSGFLYAVSVAGVTGARRALPAETKNWLASLRRLSKKPVCVGFGISGPQQIKDLRKSVDGFIVGSALIDIVRKNKISKRTAAMTRFIRALSKECQHGH